MVKFEIIVFLSLLTNIRIIKTLSAYLKFKTHSAGKILSMELSSLNS
uniref:Transcriptional regulator n=1 Tax=Heterorhabditis bacteriophora TaxID=37862 RepID=A0A1I7WKN3_HETBA